MNADTTPEPPGPARRPFVPLPPYRRLRGYAFDPSLSVELETALVNEVVFQVPWESKADGTLKPGPIGEYLEVVDFDPASGCFYDPVDLDEPLVLAQDGLPPSEASPQFHQQMVYAVAMTTIRNFERALGRLALWAPHYRNQEPGFVRRLRIYPHALRDANAYYSPTKKALLFGYFPAPAGHTTGRGKARHVSGSWVFTCLSHDIIAHETTHALLDGMNPLLVERTHPDSLAFHEAFADLVALFQHFTFPTVLRHQLARTRGDLASQNLLGQLAQELGQAIGQHGALRDALGRVDPRTGAWAPLEPDPDLIEREREPHARGALLVAAVFDAFLAIYRGRVADLLRIASDGTGVLPQGQLQPDLVNRLAFEASKSARHVLQMCIRALDYLPPVDVTFGDFLRAIITADSDVVRDDDLGYRVAFIEAFRRRGLVPAGLRAVSVDSLRWPVARHEEGRSALEALAELLQADLDRLRSLADRKSRDIRREAFEDGKSVAQTIEDVIAATHRDAVTRFCGTFLALDNAQGVETDATEKPRFKVHHVRLAERQGPDGDSVSHAIVAITQERTVLLEADREFILRGGCTLIFDLRTLEPRYVIGKAIHDVERERRQRALLLGGLGSGLRSTYFGRLALSEPFAALHRPTGDDEP